MIIICIVVPKYPIHSLKRKTPEGVNRPKIMYALSQMAMQVHTDCAQFTTIEVFKSFPKLLQQ